MKKMMRIVDQDGRAYFVTSLAAWARYARREESIRTAIFAGEEYFTPRRLEKLFKVAPGVYRFNLSN